MQEFRVTARGKTYALDRPFVVLATQNPIELEGTYPLPEAQLDRFVFNVVLDYLDAGEEVAVVERNVLGIVEEDVAACADAGAILDFQRLVREVPMAGRHHTRFAVNLVRATRPDAGDATERVRKYLNYGASVRAAIYLCLGARARALLAGRYHVTADDIRALAAPVLRHRLQTNYLAEADGRRGRRRHRGSHASGTRGGIAAPSRDERPGVSGGRRGHAAGFRRRCSRNSGAWNWLPARAVDGVLHGSHTTDRPGFSQEFAEYRDYVPGDDLRFVDWNAYARTDRLYLKRFEGETNTRLLVVLDISASMGRGWCRDEQAGLRHLAGGGPRAHRAAATRRCRVADIQ